MVVLLPRTGILALALSRRKKVCHVINFLNAQWTHDDARLFFWSPDRTSLTRSYHKQRDVTSSRWTNLFSLLIFSIICPTLYVLQWYAWNGSLSYTNVVKAEHFILPCLLRNKNKHNVRPECWCSFTSLKCLPWRPIRRTLDRTDIVSFKSRPQRLKELLNDFFFVLAGIEDYGAVWVADITLPSLWRRGLEREE